MILNVQLSNKSYMPLVCGVCVFLLLACSHPATVPSVFTEVSDSAVIYPDYRDVTIPPNIAPMNFMVMDTTADAFVTDIDGIVCGAGKDGKMDIDSTAWRRLLQDRRGKDMHVTIYARRADGWVRQPGFALHVAEEEIDPYVTYRLIEPGYELYLQLGIYQRNMTNFDVLTVYENDRDVNSGENHCINCHNFQNNDTERMYMHVRENHKGTIFTHGKDARKVIIRHESIITSGAYGNWHPFLPLVAFSTNKTEQFFHFKYRERIETYDQASDLLLYDADHNEVQHIIRSSDHFETFPCWSPDGTRLYYCDGVIKDTHGADPDLAVIANFDSLYYDIYSMPFDTVTRTFGEPRLEVNASAQNLSCSVPRVSPDGKYLLFALAKYGQFHLYHRNSDQWVKKLVPDTLASSEKQDFPADAALSASYPLTATNSPEADSFHSWSSNSRWFVFSSRRDDTDYTRTYIAYFDKQGRGHRAFLLPQRDPEYNLMLLKSFNVPELTRNPVRVTAEKLEHVIRRTEGELATYK